MAPRAPVSIGINPTIAVYSIVLGGACAVAAYTEKYRRDQDEIDDRLKEMYYTNMREQQAKTPQITSTIRGQDMRLDDAMNKWVWGGKANLSGGSTGNSSSTPLDDSDSENDSQQERSRGNKEDDEVDEIKLSKKERKRRRKERKEKQRKEEEERRKAEQKKLVVQSVAAGAAVGSVAVAVSMFMSSSRK